MSRPDLMGMVRAIAGTARFAGWLERTHWRAMELPDRGEWMRSACVDLLDLLHIRRQVFGPVPSRGLLVANHLSYLDVLVLGASAPGTFVCKREVSSWPLIGSLLRQARTLFVDRSSRRDASRLALELGARSYDELVILFPEGTTSPGTEILPFHSALLGSWSQGGRSIQPAALGYRTAAGDAAERVSFCGESSFVPHLFHLLGRRDIEAKLVFGPPLIAQTDRKHLAKQLERLVRQLHEDRIAPWQCSPPTAKSAPLARSAGAVPAT